MEPLITPLPGALRQWAGETEADRVKSDIWETGLLVAFGE